MKSLEQKVENQVQFWSLLGPFLLLVTIAVLLFKLSAHWYFPVSAMIGIPLCVKWKLKGLAASLTCLFILSLISYQSLDLDQRYWHVGMAIAMAFSFAILTLSLEEVESLVDRMQRESQSRLDNFLILDEAAKKAEETWSLEKANLTAQLNASSQELSQVSEEKQVFYKLAQLAKDELLQIRSQQELLQQDLFYKKHQISQLSEKLEGSEIALQDLINSDSGLQLKALNEKLDQSAQVQKDLQIQLDNCQKQLESVLRDKDKLEIQLKDQSEKNEANEVVIRKAHLENEQSAHSLEQLQDYVKTIENEKDRINDAFVTLKSQHEKVLLSESHYRQTLQNQEMLNREQEINFDQINKEFEALQELKSKLDKQIIQKELDNQQKIERLEVCLEKSAQELASKNHALVQAEEGRKKLLNELESAAQKLSSLLDECDQLRNSQGCLKRELEFKKVEFAALQSQLAASEKYQAENSIDNGQRKIECMFAQLKSQFQEKSTILDQTRRELFIAEEKVLVLQKKLEESEVYSLSETESLLLMELTKLINQFDKAQKENEFEMQILQEIVSSVWSKN